MYLSTYKNSPPYELIVKVGRASLVQKLLKLINCGNGVFGNLVPTLRHEILVFAVRKMHCSKSKHITVVNLTIDSISHDNYFLHHVLPFHHDFIECPQLQIIRVGYDNPIKVIFDLNDMFSILRIIFP